jgi:hypothetical protein
MLGKVGFKVPGNINCDDLGTVEPFKTVAAHYKTAGVAGADGTKFNFFDAEMFDFLFPNREDAIVKMVNFVNTKGAEAEYYYTCVDSFSFPAFLAQVKALGIPIPPEAIKAIDIFNKLSVVFKKLGMTLRAEGGFVLGPRPANAAAVTTLQTAVGGSLAKYGWSDMAVLDKSKCV